MDRTEVIRRRYNRISRVYDFMEKVMETGRFRNWRQQLMSYVKGPAVLEVGVGTGASFPYYPEGVRVTAIDFSPGMLARARAKAERLGISVQLELMDVQQLAFADNSFDNVITSCVFCSVPDALRGLKEIHRVLKPTGELLMIEHVLSSKPIVRQVMQLVNPLVVGAYGANINRETGRTLRDAGFKVREQDLWFDIVKFFRARPMK